MNDNEHTNERAMIFLFAATILGLMLYALAASAQESPTPAAPLPLAEQELALSVARVCANEAFRSRPDCLLIWQATRRHGENAEARLDWLRRHSRCVLGPSDPSPSRTRIGNCRWTRYLNREGTEPRNWPHSIPWQGANQRMWLQTLAMVENLVRGMRPREGWPCEIDPDTWAGRRTDEQRIAQLPPTMVPLRCATPAHGNEGFRVMTSEQRARYEARFVDVNPGQSVDRD